MSKPVFAVSTLPTIAIRDEDPVFPVHRIFCVGRNYAAHAAEMGHEPDREAPFYFTKSPSATTPTGATIPYPLMTHDLHHEIELAVAIGAPAFRVDPAQALDVVFGYCTALDMTRRDLQQAAKDKRRPWDLGKDFENSAVFAPITRATRLGEISDRRIWLAVNGIIRQDATIGDLIHSIPNLIADLSRHYHLVPGDIILTGTPAGVGPVVAGDIITGGIDGLDPIQLTIGPVE